MDTNTALNGKAPEKIDLSLRAARDSTVEKPDAGLLSQKHYRTRLTRWRYAPRQLIIPLVRWETPYLGYLQSSMRCAPLDFYFSITANLGTHTFFMTVLPILFWSGYTTLGRGMVHILASGVFFSGFLKDLLCIPRPLSPPLQRITMSKSASLEYGFPSTHSTNAASVAVYALFFLRSPETPVNPQVKTILQCCSYGYLFSIVLGRLYCGMHGFLDVIVGTALGAMLSVIQCTYGEAFDTFINNGSLKAPFVTVLIILILVRIHPEPADNCPCFDDSVAFAGVIIGIELGFWHYARSGLAWNDPVPATVPFSLEELGWTITILRVIIGVIVIFSWRQFMKPTLFKILPPIFRVVETLGLSLPRRFFTQASEYTEVPMDLKDDNVIPYVSSISSMMHTIRHPRRSQSVTLGPQSQADAYETLAYREKRRRESTSGSAVPSPRIIDKPKENGTPSGYFSVSKIGNRSPWAPLSVQLPTPAQSVVDLYQDTMGAEVAVSSPLTPISQPSATGSSSRSTSQDRRQYEKEEREMLSILEKPRVRYDVEVITKLIVYTGIAWLAVEGNPLLFECLSLGIKKPAG